MDLLSAAVDRARAQAPAAVDSNQAATERAQDPDWDRSDRKVSSVEFRVFLCSSLFSAQRRINAQRSQALN
jgi:hypothetical protein